MLAVALNTPELALTDQEAEYVSKSYVAWARHHNMMMSEKTMDTGNLVLALTVVYGGRLVGIGKKKRDEAAKRKQGLPLTVQVQTAAPGPAPVQPKGPAPSKPSGIAPATRRATAEDNAMLDEIAVPAFAMHAV